MKSVATCMLLCFAFLAVNGFQACSNSKPLGVENWKIPDNRITASSEWDYNHGPANGRLNFKPYNGRRGAWSAKTNDLNQWIQFDFQYEAIVDKIFTQGRDDYSQWVKTYTVSYSNDGINFNYYRHGHGGMIKVFHGNNDKNSIVDNDVSPFIVARFVRIHPKSWYAHISMRVEFSGCLKGCSNPGPLGLENEGIPDNKITASSQWDNFHGPNNGRLNFKPHSGRTGAWSSKTNDLNQWIQFDFQYETTVDKILSQGRADDDQWVKTYTVSYSTDGINFKYDRHGPVIKVHHGNYDRNTTVENDFSPFIVARYVRIHPKSWYGHISMRIGFRGCFNVCRNPRPLGLENGKIPDDRITASSEWNNVHGPANGRLNFKPRNGSIGAWSSKTNDLEQWIQFDFQYETIVDKILTQGRADYDQWVKTYTVSYSTDGMSFNEYQYGGMKKIFHGNNDRNTIVENDFSPFIVARYVRIHPKSWYGHISMRVEFHGCLKGCRNPRPLGLENGEIPDDMITATSEWNNVHGPANGRLNFKPRNGRTGGWSSKTNDLNQWIQFDFQYETIVDKILTQGRADYSQWVKTYTVSYSTDGMKFNDYLHGGMIKVFDGNYDRDTIVRNDVSPFILARHVRIHPKSWYGHISMRVELRGCSKGCSHSRSLGLENEKMPDHRITASSELNNLHGPANGRLNFKPHSGRTGAWSSKTNDLNQWIQFDFQYETVVEKILTQGRADVDQWVNKFTVSYSLDGIDFFYYRHGGVIKVFNGNSDRNTIVNNDVSPFILARFVRIHPKSWYGHISMRVEFYGCLKVCSNPKPLGLETGKMPDDRMTASSEWDSVHGPANGRLNFKPRNGRTGGWSSKPNDLSQWIQFDFQYETIVDKILTQGRYDYDQWVKTYTVSYSIDGMSFTDYGHGGMIKVFHGNNDRNTVVENSFSPFIVARYVRIHPTSWYGHISMRFEFHGCLKGCAHSRPLGLESEKIPDHRITASSERNNFHGPANGRLNFKPHNGRTGAWSSKTNDLNQWIQFDFHYKAIVEKILTQGRPDANQWVTTFTVSYSLDGTNFLFYRHGGMIKIFHGNNDRNTTVENHFLSPIVARVLRIHPKSWYGHISLRAEFYGCIKGCSSPKPLGRENGKIPDNRITVSSGWKNTHGAGKARLNLKPHSSRTGTWTSKTNDLNQWIQFDLQYETMVEKILTRGRADHNQWVKTYTVSYSTDGMNFNDYRQGGIIKAFHGNNDSNTIVKNDFSPFILARYVRIHPKSWYGHISMRAELHGCLKVCSDPRPLGLESGEIPDNRITASSEWDNVHGPANGRINLQPHGGRTGAWSSKTNDQNQWIQFDFQYETIVDKILTQGRVEYDQWVKTYAVSYSNDGTSFKYCQDDEVIKVFNGNHDRNTIIENDVSPSIVARYVRIHPKSWYGHISMRVEIYGCLKGCSNPGSLGLKNGIMPDNMVTASSEWDNDHGPANGRLNFKPRDGRTGAWSSKTNNLSQWIQFDFQNEAIVEKILTQGRADENQWVKTYTIAYSTDEMNFKDYRQGGKIKVFNGNNDRNTIVENDFSPFVLARFVRIHPKSWYGHISMRADFHGCLRGCSNSRLLPLHKGKLPGNKMTISSLWNNVVRPHNGRLNFKPRKTTGTWSSKTNYLNQLIQFEFPYVTIVDKILTQGLPDANQWVKTYTVSYSIDGTNFRDYQHGGVIKIFNGNNDSNTTVENHFSPFIVARFVRINPKLWYGDMSMRTEFYGCLRVCSNPKPLGLENGEISDVKITASSEWNNFHGPANGRLNFLPHKGRTGAWSSKTNDLNQWIQLDFEYETIVDKILSQGRADYDQWVKTYTVSYSTDGMNFKDYLHGGMIKIFHGNNDRNTIVENNFSPIFVARFVRIHPKSWQGHISMRAEFYGCLKGNLAKLL